MEKKLNKHGLTTKKLLLIILIVALLLGFLFFYFYNQRRRNFVTQAKEYINELRELVTEELVYLPDTNDETVIISVSQLNPKKGVKKTPFGANLVKEKSYIKVKNSGTEYTPVYDYYITLEDEKGNCIPLTVEKKLNRYSVKKDCNIEEVHETGAKYITE